MNSKKNNRNNNNNLHIQTANIILYQKSIRNKPELIEACGARSTNNISIECEIQWNFVILLCITYSVGHDILHTSRK